MCSAFNVSAIRIESIMGARLRNKIVSPIPRTVDHVRGQTALRIDKHRYTAAVPCKVSSPDFERCSPVFCYANPLGVDGLKIGNG